MVRRGAGTAGTARAPGEGRAGSAAQPQGRQGAQRGLAVRPAGSAAPPSRARQQGAEERRTAERREMLQALRPVKVADLADFEDLPGAGLGQRPGATATLRRQVPEEQARQQRQEPQQAQRQEPQETRQQQQPEVRLAAAIEQPGMQPRQGAGSASASYGGSSSEEAEGREQALSPEAASRDSRRLSRLPTSPEVASQATGLTSCGPEASGTPPASGAAASGGSNIAAATAQRQPPAKQRIARCTAAERMGDDTADKGPAQRAAAPAGETGQSPAAAAAGIGHMAAVEQEQGSRQAAAAAAAAAGSAPTAQAVQAGTGTGVSDTASTAAAAGPEAGSAAEAEPPAAKRCRSVRFADEAEGAGAAPRLRDRLLQRVLKMSVHAAGTVQQAQQQPAQVPGAATAPSPSAQPTPAAAAPQAVAAAPQPAATAPLQPAGAQQAAQGAVASSGTDVCRLLLQHCQSEDAQAAGLDGRLVGTFTGGAQQPAGHTFRAACSAHGPAPR